MAEGVFHRVSEAGKGLFVSFRDEEWIVAKPAATSWLCDDSTLYCTGKAGDFAAVFRENHRAAEACAAVGDSLHFAEQAGIICSVIALGATVAGGPHARCPAKGVHLEAGVVGEHKAAHEAADSEGLEAGIFEKRAAGFLDLRQAGKRGGIQHFEVFTDHRADFRGFMRIAGGDDEFWCRLHGEVATGRQGNRARI